MNLHIIWRGIPPTFQKIVKKIIQSGLMWNASLWKNRNRTVHSGGDDLDVNQTSKEFNASKRSLHEMVGNTLSDALNIVLQ